MKVLTNIRYHRPNGWYSPTHTITKHIDIVAAPVEAFSKVEPSFERNRNDGHYQCHPDFAWWTRHKVDHLLTPQDRKDGLWFQFEDKVCTYCGKAFHTASRAYNHCSDECRTAHTLERRQQSNDNRPRAQVHPVTCAECGESFTAKRKDAAYCSTRCRVAHHRGERRP